MLGVTYLKCKYYSSEPLNTSFIFFSLSIMSVWASLHSALSVLGILQVLLMFNKPHWHLLRFQLPHHDFLLTFHSIPWFRVPWGYPIPRWYMSSIPIPPYCGMKTHTIPHSYQYHVTYHTIPYHTIWPHTILSGVSGVLVPNMKSISEAAVLVHWAPSFVDRFFRFLLSF